MIVLLNKPFGVLSQFTTQEGHRTLADLVDVPNVYAAGRLDKDSEGLLLLTDDGKLQHAIASPNARSKMPKTYWVQVERVPDNTALEALRQGVDLKDGRTRPAQVRRLESPQLWPRDPPIRERKSIPTAWVEIVLTEGRNRQVRRMTAHVGFPTLRLVRRAIGPWTVDGLEPGAWREADAHQR